MTRKDFILIAAALREAQDRIDRIQADLGEEDGPAFRSAHFGIQIATETLADALRSTNGRFDRDRFMTAAGQS